MNKLAELELQYKTLLIKLHCIVHVLLSVGIVILHAYGMLSNTQYFVVAVTLLVTFFMIFSFIYFWKGYGGYG